MEAAEAWDTSKENFAPVRAGRSGRALREASVTPGKAALTDLDDRRRKFLDEIAENQQDPLPVWLRYVKWTQEAFPMSGGKDQLLKTLEAATKALSACDRYNDDPRFLRLWIQYADCLPDPSDVFVFLQDRGIGRDLALLYEAYATFLELKGNYPRADLVYQEGVNRSAKPVERLRTKHSAFQQRMAKRLQRQAQEQALGMAPAPGEDVARGALRDLHSSVPEAADAFDENGQRIQSRRRPPRSAAPQNLGVTGVQPARPGSVAAAGLLTGRSAVAAAGSLLPPPVNPAGAPGGVAPPAAPAAAGFEVCVDEEFQSGVSGPAGTAFPPRLGHLQALPAYGAVRKENTAAAGIWAGARLKQDASMLPPAGPPKLEICTDDEFREDEEEEAAAAAAAAAAVARRQQEQRQLVRGGGSGTSCGVFAPIPLGAATGHAGPTVALPPPVVPVAAGVAGKLGASTAASPVERPSSSGRSSRSSSSSSSSVTVPAAAASFISGGYQEALLVGPDGKEQCFEEARAAAWFARPRPAPAASDPAAAETPVPAVQQETAQHPEKQLQQQVEEASAVADSTPAVIALAEVTAAEEDVPATEELLAPAVVEAAAPEAAADARARAAAEAPEAAPILPAEVTATDAAAVEPAVIAEPQACVEAAAAPSPEPEAEAEAEVEASPTEELQLPTATADVAATEETVAVGPASPLAAEPAVLTAEQEPLGDAEALQEPPCASAGPSFADPTVTISTRAALNAINAVFAEDLTASAAPPPSVALGHTGSLRDRARGRRSMGPGMGLPPSGAGLGSLGSFNAAGSGSFGSSAADPTVTISTRAALNSINNMFGADLTGAVAPSPVVSRGRPSMRFPGLGGGAEPTMTVNTREAMALVNGMFCDEAPAQMGGDVTQRMGGRGRPSMGLGLYEDTEFLGGPAAASRARSRRSSVAPGGLGLYEDTEFITGAVAAAAAASRRSRRSSVAPVGGLGLYEDTEFITGAVAAAAVAPSAAGGAGADAGVGGLGLYEDTEFITRTVPGRPSVAPSGGLDLRADTEFLTARCSPPRPLLQPAAAPAVRPAAAEAMAGPAAPFVGDENAGPPPATSSPDRPSAPFADRCDSFEVMPSPQALRERAERGIAGSTGASPASSPDKEGPKENEAPGGGCGADEPRLPLAPRSLADPMARAAALRPISAERAALLGVQVEEGAGEEATIAAADAENAGPGSAAAAAAAATALTSPSRGPLRSLFHAHETE